MRRKSILTIVAVLTPLFLMACAGTPLQTPSGRPEVVVLTSDVGKVRGSLIDAFSTSGFALVNDTPNSLHFMKKMSTGSSILYKTLLGNSYSSDPEWEVNVTTVTQPDNVKVFASAFTTMQNAFGRVDRQDMTTGKAGAQLQTILEMVKLNIEEGPLPEGRVGILLDGKMVTQVMAGGPAEAAGLRVGDRILEVDGQPLDGRMIHDLRILRGAPGSTAVLKIDRDWKKMTIEVVRSASSQ